jgi:hypothetical protein
MAHSFIHYKENEALIGDGYIYRIIYLLDDVYQRSPSGSADLSDLFEWLLEVMDHCAPGCIDLRLDEFLDTASKVQRFVALIEGAISRAGDFGETLPGAFFNDRVQATAVIFDDIETQKVVSKLERIKSILIPYS